MTAPPAVALSNRARWALVVSALVTLALYVIPHGRYLAYPLLLISTLVHELGHGVAAVLMGGEFVSFKMWADGSGVAMHSGPAGGAAAAFVAAGGLCGPAVAAAVMIGVAPRPTWARYALGAFGAALTLAIILVVRNGFGVAFTGILAALALLIAIRGSANFAQGALLFLAVQLALSVYSRGDYLFMKEARTEMGVMPSDSQHMAMAMGGSYWFWGLMCALFSAAMLAAGAYVFWRGTHRGAAVRKPTPGGTKLSPRAR
jgi:hypothetical protein